MKVEEVVLPGVGRKYTITVKSGDRIVIVVHSSGKRELQYFEAGEEDERSKLGAKVIEWVKVLPGSKLAGKRVGDLALPPGAHLLAVDRPGAPLIPHPGPDVVLEVGDTLVVAGSREAVEALKGGF